MELLSSISNIAISSLPLASRKVDAIPKFIFAPFLLDKTLYPHPKDWTGGDRHRIYGFKATKKGTYKIKFESYTLTVNVV